MTGQDSYRLSPLLTKLHCVAQPRAGLLALFLLSLMCGGFVSDARAGNLGLNAPKEISLSGRSLLLNGQGRETKHFLVLYGCALYVEKPGVSYRDIERPDTPVAFRIEITFDQLPPEMPEAWGHGFQRTVTAEEYEIIKTAYSKLRAGDVVLIWYQPSQGTTVLVNDKNIVTTSDDTLIKAFMSLWLEDNPSSNSLKAALLQQKG